MIDFSKSQGSDVVAKSLHSIDRGGGKYTGTAASGSRKSTRLVASKMGHLAKPRQEAGTNDDGLVHHFTEDIAPKDKFTREDPFFYLNYAQLRQPPQT